jgi:hypothetical protein
MRPFSGGATDEEDANWDFAMTIPESRTKDVYTGTNEKGLQFHSPLLEFYAAARPGAVHRERCRVLDDLGCVHSGPSVPSR